mgnify:CR=1 FL=1
MPVGQLSQEKFPFDDIFKNWFPLQRQLLTLHPIQVDWSSLAVKLVAHGVQAAVKDLGSVV